MTTIREKHGKKAFALENLLGMFFKSQGFDVERGDDLFHDPDLKLKKDGKVTYIEVKHRKSIVLSCERNFGLDTATTIKIELVRLQSYARKDKPTYIIAYVDLREDKKYANYFTHGIWVIDAKEALKFVEEDERRVWKEPDETTGFQVTMCVISLDIGKNVSHWFDIDGGLDKFAELVKTYNKEDYK